MLMTRPLARFALLAAVAAVAVVAALLLRPAHDEGERELIGSWFVRYRTDPTPYLDAAFDGSSAITRLTADLTGPERVYPDIDMRWVPKEDEWQHPSSFLPDPLPPGTWWVSRLRAELRGGGQVEWIAGGPDELYEWSNSAGESGHTSAFAGAFTMPPSGVPMYAIDTLPVAGGTEADTYLRISRLDEPDTPIALNDDADVQRVWASVWTPLQPGTYLVRVDGRDDNIGDYAIRFARQGDPPPAEVTGPKAAEPDPYEPDDQPDQATELVLGVTQVHTLSPRRELLGDQDWFRIEVPAE
jgi:hypothetical protein